MRGNQSNSHEFKFEEWPTLIETAATLLRRFRVTRKHICMCNRQPCTALHPGRECNLPQTNKKKLSRGQIEDLDGLSQEIEQKSRGECSGVLSLKFGDSYLRNQELGVN